MSQTVNPKEIVPLETRSALTLNILEKNREHAITPNDTSMLSVFTIFSSLPIFDL